MTRKAVIALNGSLQTENLLFYKRIIEKGNTLIAADGGEKLFSRLNYIPDVIIGDLDSLKVDIIKYYQKRDTEIIKYPPEKDETDGELALQYCRDNDIENIIFTNTLGGRLDHQLANIYLLEYALILGLKAVIEEPEIEIGIINKEKVFIGKKGYTLSILPLSEEVGSVENFGFKYPLSGEKLLRYKTRGISNIITAEKAGISIAEGKLIYILNKNN